MSNRLAVFESFVGRERALCESGLGAEKATALKLLSEAGTLPLSREAPIKSPFRQVRHEVAANTVSGNYKAKFVPPAGGGLVLGCRPSSYE